MSDQANTPEARYLQASGLWRHLGLRPDEADLRAALALRRARPDLRWATGWLAYWHPCDVFLRPLRRAVEAGERRVDWSGWLGAYPELKPWLERYVIERAKRFRQASESVDWSLIWGRWFDGGDEAWRHVALTLKYRDGALRRLYEHRVRRQGWSVLFDGLRHDLGDHGALSAAEGARINHFLEAIGAEPLEVIPRGHWWQADAPDAWRAAPHRARLLEGARAASRALAGGAWSDEDERRYDAAGRKR